MLCAGPRLGSFVLGLILISLLAACSFTSQSLLLFVFSQRHISIEKRRQKHITEKVIKFPNRFSLLTLYT